MGQEAEEGKGQLPAADHLFAHSTIRRFASLAWARVAVGVIVAAYVALGWLYATHVPKWNAPDEPAHYNYVRSLAETGTLPVLQMGDYDYARIEALMGTKFPDGQPVDWIRYESHQPPLYYFIGAPVYAATAGLSVEARVIALRLLSVLIGALGIVVIYRIVREVFPEAGGLALAVSAFAAFVPMRVFIYAAINNDALAEVAVDTLLLLLLIGLRRSARGTSRRYDLVVGVAIGLALLTKVVASVGIVLVAAAYLMVELAPPAAQAPTTTRLLRLGKRLALVYGTALVVSGWWFVRGAVVYGPGDFLGLGRHAEVVAGQPLTGDLSLAALQRFGLIAFKSFWAQFGWMGILVDERIYLALAALCGVAGLGALLYLLRVVRRPPTLSPFQAQALGLMLLSLVLVVVGVFGYNLTFLQPQGRYFFPSIASLALLFVVGLREIVAREYAGLATGLVAVGLFGLTALSLFNYVVPAFR